MKEYNFSIKKHNRSIAGKIIITGLLACGAIFLSLYISRYTFGNILYTVDKLSKPNIKIQLVNDLFRDVVKLDQLQRDQALNTQTSEYNPFLTESDHLQLMLDSLRNMSLQNREQVERIDSMKKILNKRDQMFIKYVELRTDLFKNDTLAGQVKSLSVLISKVRSGIDSNRITTSVATKTIIDTLKQEEKKQNLWKRIFTKRKSPVQQVQKEIKEVLNVRVDTISMGGKGDSLVKMGKAITRVETNRVARRGQLVAQQVELNQTGDVLISQLISILNEIEQDELLHKAQQDAMAKHQVSNGITNISIVLVIFVTGTGILIFLIFTDIRRSNQYRRQLIAAKEEAEEAGLVKQRFLANMSHELRTPLQSIIGISEQVRGVKQPRQQDLENIHQSSLHLLQIVNEVLDYSRITSGKYTLESKPFNMHHLLDEVKEMIQVQLALKKLAMAYSVHVPADQYYSGDPFRLKQVLLNLLGNAVKFTDKGTVSFSVDLQDMPDGKSVFTFVVKDTGIGISKEDQGKIFNQFEQGSNQHKKPGTGLGLSIVKAMVDIQKGDIKVDSLAGKGTTFSVSLPYVRTEASVPQVAATAAHGKFVGHVWIVDDDVFILQLCDTILTKNNIPHTCFSSSKEALATPFPAGLKIVFLDIRMAEMDGITLCNKLKERVVAHMPEFVALTAQAMPDEQARILQNGFDRLVMKPFLEAEFINAVYKHEEVMQTVALPLLDLTSIYKMAAGDEEMLQMVLQSFITETEKDRDSARICMDKNDGHGVAEALHKLAGRCGQMGATALSQSLRKLEIALFAHKDCKEVKAEVTALDNEIVLMISEVKEVLKGKPSTTDC